MAAGETIRVEVAYARAAVQVVLPVVLPAGGTLEEAVRRSGILARFAEIDLQRLRVGVWGHLRSLSTTLRDGDRVEIYRPLVADPKEIRRRRAAQDKRSPSAERPRRR